MGYMLILATFCIWLSVSTADQSAGNQVNSTISMLTVQDLAGQLVVNQLAILSILSERPTPGEDQVMSTVVPDENISTHQSECRAPFTNIRGRCFMVETALRASWSAVNNYCHEIGGQLAKLDDANILYHLYRFIYDNDLNKYQYWIGATDEEEEGNYRWLDGSTVLMGPPYWGYHHSCDFTKWIPEPNEGTSANCAMLWREAFYLFGDQPCHYNNGGICEQVN